MPGVERRLPPKRAFSYPIPLLKTVRRLFTPYSCYQYERSDDVESLLISCLELESLGLLPAEVLVGAEVTVLGSLEVDGLGKVKLLDNDTGTHVEVVADNLDEVGRGLLGGAVGVDEDGEGLGNTNGVRQLHQATTGQVGGNQGLGDPSGQVGSGTVDLGEVLAGEGTTTVSTPATVGVNNDLAAGQTGVTLRTTDDEETRRLDLWGCQ